MWGALFGGQVRKMSDTVKAQFEIDSLDDIIIRRKIVSFTSLLHAGRDELGRWRPHRTLLRCTIPEYCVRRSIT
jgi:hypothetical protein